MSGKHEESAPAKPAANPCSACGAKASCSGSGSCCGPVGSRLSRIALIAVVVLAVGALFILWDAQQAKQHRVEAESAAGPAVLPGGTGLRATAATVLLVFPAAPGPAGVAESATMGAVAALRAEPPAGVAIRLGDEEEARQWQVSARPAVLVLKQGRLAARLAGPDLTVAEILAAGTGRPGDPSPGGK
ncbi:MAG: hypothetical protein WC789_11575 [Lentisphaeria bacterium]|jgi:hypothetical protein